MIRLRRLIGVGAAACAAALVLAGCATVEEIGSAAGRTTERFLDGLKGKEPAAPNDQAPPKDQGASKDQGAPDRAPGPARKEAAHREVWEAPDLDLGKGVDDLSQVERQVVLELNKARTDPARYARLYIEPRLGLYRGRDYVEPGRVTIRTNEGRAAVEECVRVLRSAAPRQPLHPARALSAAARDHVRDTGPRGSVGHAGNDGSSPALRVRRHDPSLRSIGENISYGPAEAREIVIALLVDDGVPSRGHRTNIMNPDYDLVGVSTGPHRTYGSMCVLDFAVTPR